MNLRRLFLTASLTAMMAGCATGPAPQSLADTLAADPSLSTLHGLVTKAGLLDTLKGAGPFTVFAPTNDAFKAVPAKTLDDLGKQPAQLKAVLTYHVVPGKLMAAEIKSAKVKSLQGADLALSKAGDFVTVEDALVLKADRVATNGVLHMVDRVLMPPRR
jgi:uncharacterized surface protein with fasciclin (FAS1) repeats